MGVFTSIAIVKEIIGAAIRLTVFRAIDFTDWEFGWGLQRDEKRNPSGFLSGEGDGSGLTRRDRLDMTSWYESHRADARRIRYATKNLDLSGKWTVPFRQTFAAMTPLCVAARRHGLHNGAGGAGARRR